VIERDYTLNLGVKEGLNIGEALLYNSYNMPAEIRSPHQGSSGSERYGAVYRMGRRLSGRVNFGRAREWGK
jgi:hypothetical protein